MSFNRNNKNYLHQNKFRVDCVRLPNLNYFVQAINLPALSLGVAEMPNPFLKAPFPGDNVQFQDLEIDFMVGEDFQNWYDIYLWMTSLGFPDSYEQYKNIKDSRLKGLDNKPYQIPANNILKDLLSPIKLFILTSKLNKNIEIDFIDCFPIYLSQLQFSMKDSTVLEQHATVRFRYQQYKITKA